MHFAPAWLIALTKREQERKLTIAFRRYTIIANLKAE